jgi:hypothetical protein
MILLVSDSNVAFLGYRYRLSIMGVDDDDDDDVPNAV